MTFSIAARCPDTGMFGMAITTSSTAVGARCCYAKAGVGAALTQHRTDPRLGPEMLRHMEAGHSAQEAIDVTVGAAENVGWRQLAAVDSTGGTGFFHGADIYSIHGAAEGDACVAIGNIVDNPSVPDGIVAAYLADPTCPFPARLIDGLQGGLAAGGEMVDVRSAALYVVNVQPFPYIDLRIDWADEPVVALGALYEHYAGEAEGFVTKVLDPASVPIEPEIEALVKIRRDAAS